MSIYFFLFLLLFFSVAQADSLTLVWSMCLGRAAQHHPWLWGTLLTLLLLLPARWCVGRLRCTQHWPYTPYVLMAWLCVTLTSLPVLTVMQSLKQAFFALLIGTIGYGVWRWKQRRRTTARHAWETLMPRMLLLLSLSVYIGLLPATTDVEQYEMQTARLVREAPSAPLRLPGSKSLAVSQRLFAERCYALSQHPSSLPEALWHWPVPPRCSSAHLLLPHDARQSLLLPPDSLHLRLGAQPLPHEAPLAYFKRCANLQGAQPSVAADYYLCGLLLDRHIDLFAREVAVYYKQALQAQALPHYYAEAMLLYTHLRTNPLHVYLPASLEANYLDFTAMADSLRQPQVRQNLTRYTYGETYYWYYHFATR